MQSIKRHIALFLLISLCSCGIKSKEAIQSTVEIDLTMLKLHASEGLFYYQESPFTGVALTYGIDGLVLESATFANGKRHGMLKKWYTDGTKSYQANYDHGRLHGSGNSWWPNGQMRSAANYVNGIAHGKQLQWYHSGAIFKEINMVQGKEQGMQKAWRENGKIYNNYEAKNGRIFGLRRSKLCFELTEEEVQYAD